MTDQNYVPTQTGTNSVPNFHLTEEDVKLNEAKQEEVKEEASELAQGFTLADLQNLAEDNNIDSSGTKAELAARLHQAGKP